MLRSAPRPLRLVVQLLLIAIVAGAALLYVPPIGAVSPETLQHSLERRTGGGHVSGDACRRRRSGVYRCLVRGRTKVVEFELTRRGRRCWDAVQVTPGSAPDLRNAVSGCMLLRDQVRI